jgi:hypothetical protein
LVSLTGDYWSRLLLNRKIEQFPSKRANNF